MANVKISELAVNSSPSASATLAGVDNGETVQIPLDSVYDGVRALSIYRLPSTNTLDNIYMSAIKDVIENNGGDITRLNYVHLRGNQLLMHFAWVGGNNYYVYALDILTLKSYNYGIDIATTTIADFLAKDSVSEYLPLSGGTMKGDINLGTDKGFTGTTASGNVFDIFRVLNSTRLQVGGTYPSLELKGKNDRPTYNGNDMALYSDIPSINGLATEGYVDAEIATAVDGLATEAYVDEKVSNMSGGGSLSMPRIRLANHWMGTDEITCDKENDAWTGGYVFSVEVMDGTVQEGDTLQVCNLATKKNSRGNYVRKPQRFAEKEITAEDIEMLSYNPYLQVFVDATFLPDLYRSCSSDGTLYRYPKYIRIRRPVYNEEGKEVSAIFSNVVCADVRIPITFI